MYLLELCNVRKIAATEARRDALLALGYREVKQSKTAPPSLTKEPAEKSMQTTTPRKSAKAK